MKTIVLILLSLFSLNTFAQDYTQWGLPEGAKMRLGKGILSGSIAYSPDGTRLAVASSIGIWLYDTATHQEVALPTEHAFWVSDVAFSPDGQTIASASSDHVRLWDAYTGEHKQTLKGQNWVSDVAFSPDGQTIAASTSQDSTILLWDVHTDEHKQTLKGHTSGVWSVAFSPDGQTIASTSSDRVLLWDAHTGEHKQTLRGHTSGVSDVAFSPDGQTIASASSDHTVRLWDAHTGEHKQTLKGHTGSVESVAFSPDGQTIASASSDRPVQRSDHTVRLWDAHTGEHKQTLKGHTGGHTSGVWSVAFSPDGQTIASASHDRTVRLWDAHTGEHKQTLRGHTSGVWSVAFSPDGQTIASASSDQVLLWDAHTGEYKQTLKGPDQIYDVAFSPDGQTIASTSQDSTILLWDAHTGEHKQTLKGPDQIYDVAFSPDGQTIASASSDQVLLWDAHTGEYKQTLKGPDQIYDVAFSPDGQTIASANSGRTVWLWDAHTGEHKQTLKKHYAIYSIAFSPDGRTIASEGWDGTILLWDAHTGEHRQTLRGHTSLVRSVAFSPDGQTLASGSRDGTILLWDLLNIPDPPVDIFVPLGFAVEKWSWLDPVAMDLITNREYGTGIIGATILNAASDYGEVLLWRYSAGSEELVARIPAELVNAVPTVRFDQTGLFDNKLFVTINAGPDGQRTTRVVIVEPNGEFRDAINIYNENSTQASIEFISQPSYPAGAYIYDADIGQGQSFYRLDESFNLHLIASHTLPSGRIDIDPMDLKADPTGKYGGLLTLSDTDLNHEGLSGLYQLQANGEWRTLVPPAPVSERQFQGIAFSNAGPLGSGLYVADAAANNIWIASPRGHIEAFVIGFVAPKRVAIGPEGADMWVTDQTGLYRIFSTDPSDWEARKATLPVASGLEPNYPNPFNSSTQISYRLSTSGPVRLVIYNTLGQPVRTLVDAIQAAGAYQVPWDGRDHRGARVANGAYLYRLQAGEIARVRKMLVLE